MRVRPVPAARYAICQGDGGPLIEVLALLHLGIVFFWATGAGWLRVALIQWYVLLPSPLNMLPHF